MTTMTPRRWTRRRRAHFLGTLGLIALSVLTIYPLIFSVLCSFKGTFEIYTNSFGLPKSWAPTNYEIALFQSNIGRTVLNSMMIAAVSVLILLVVSSMASYALARMRFQLNGAVFAFFILGITVPVHSTIIPLYKTVAAVNMLDQYLPLYLMYVGFHLARSILIITGNMRSISHEIEESAIIDGCGPAGIFSRIIVPLSAPAISTAGTISFLYIYNDLLFPMLFINSKDKYTISQGLMSFQGEFSMELGPIFAAIIVCVTPMIIIFLLFQKQVISGIASGAVKG